MLMAAELKGYDCTDHDPVDQYRPRSDEVFYWLTLSIGPAGEDAADLFSAVVATPSGLQRAKQEGHRIGPRPPIIVEPYSWSSVLAEVQSRISRCEPDVSWSGLSTSLRRFFAWEYDRFEERGR